MTPKIPLSRCKRCKHYRRETCQLPDLEPCNFEEREDSKDRRMRTRIGLACTFILAVICAAILALTGCTAPEDIPQPSRGGIYVQPFEYNGHSYLSILRPGSYGFNVLHDPDCWCQKTKVLVDTLSDWQKLTMAIALTESRFNPKADSGHGDSGLLQLRSIYIDEVNRLYGTEYTIEDAFDIDKSLAIFRALQAHYNPTKDLDKAIYYHNKSAAYKRAVMENYELVCRYEAVRTKLIEK